MAAQRFAGAGSRRFTLLSMALAAAEAAQVGSVVTDLTGMVSLTVQATFVRAAGGTTAQYWIQTSFDQGVTWVDIMCFAFATTTVRVVSSVRMQTAVAANYTATDGTLTDNTIKDGLLGDRLRVKRTTVGTYSGASSIALDAVTKAA